MTKSEIIDKANDREFYLNIGTNKYLAKLSGKKLDYPIIEAGQISAEISWSLAEKIAIGITKDIDY